VRLPHEPGRGHRGDGSAHGCLVGACDAPSSGTLRSESVLCVLPVIRWKPNRRACAGPHRFSQSRVEERILQVNGVVVKFTGTCRHEEFSPTATLERRMLEDDITLMKQTTSTRFAPAITTTRPVSWNCATRPVLRIGRNTSCWVRARSTMPTALGLHSPLDGNPQPRQEPRLRGCLSCGNESSYGSITRLSSIT